MISNEKLLEFEIKLQYQFHDISLLKMALTHKSYAYENPNATTKIYNERIEFLGDAILEHVISDLLYHHESNFSEGQMSKKRAGMVCEYSLSQAMKRIGAQEYIYLGKCERTTNGKMKDAILADAFEAVLGAIYLDGGYEIARKTVLRLLKEEIELILSGKEWNVDYKTRLQEKLQEHGTVKISYSIDKEYGLEHDKTFEVSVYVNQKKIGSGVGKNKKQAEQMAAKDALEKNEK